jgi:surfactin synthase thioesterase subunit
MENYGREQVRVFDVTQITVPVAMFTGKFDRVVSVNKNQKYAEKMNAVIHFEVLEADHLSVLIGKDMSYMEKVISLLLDRNPHSFEWEKVFGDTDKSKYSKWLKSRKERDNVFKDY